MLAPARVPFTLTGKLKGRRVAFSKASLRGAAASDGRTNRIPNTRIAAWPRRFIYLMDSHQLGRLFEIWSIPD